jgi:hypothetical protein
MCQKASFLPMFYHIAPYYTRSEILNHALNLNLIEGNCDNKEYEKLNYDDIKKLCKILSKHEMTAETLLNHQEHILNSGKMGLVQYYTLQGSYFVNKYLRNNTGYSVRNDHLENIINNMWHLIHSAPAFDKDYVFYRFVQEDIYLENIEIGDIFTEKGIMSTTRDPFYRSDLYKFGFILLKIRVPKNKKGIGLCLETVSHYPEEQEIIFPPYTQFKLIKRDTKCSYYHTDTKYAEKIKTKYEFEWVGNEKIIEIRNTKESKSLITHTIDLLNTPKMSSNVSIEEKIKNFEQKYINEISQFNIILGDKNITVISERYDSTSAYKNFYAVDTDDGYSLYALLNNYILFFIEIDFKNKDPALMINYYVKYSGIDTSKLIGDDNLIKFFSSVAYYFDIPTIVLYADYMNCNVNIHNQINNTQRTFATDNKNINIDYVTNTKILFNSSYCEDLYKYLATNKKKYNDINALNIELYPKFSYSDLDLLKFTTVDKIISSDDKDEIYQLYKKTYTQIKHKNNIADFYLWLKDNNCYLLEKYVAKIDRLLGKKNPFRNDMYILDPLTYLYNRNLISYFPTYSSIAKEIKRDILVIK